MAESDQIARLRIALDDVAPVILRRIEVPVGVRLDDLHLYFQIAMGWENCHLYEFRTRGDRWGLVDPDFAELDVISANEATLAELLKRGGAKTFKYVYDFGDGWEHTVKVEALDQPATGAGYPRLLEARRRCPPEDVGGPWGYARYLKALADPDHERHDEFVEWRGPGFDPALVDEATIRKAFDRLAKKASPRASKVAAKRRH